MVVTRTTAKFDQCGAAVLGQLFNLSGYVRLIVEQRNAEPTALGKIVRGSRPKAA
jgi:hypothetical protein